MNRLLSILMILVLLGGGFLLYRHWFPSDETRIKKLLHKAAEAVSIAPDASTFSKLAAINQLLNLCDNEIEILVSAPGIGRRTISGKDELKAVMAAVHRTQEGIKIKLRELSVEINSPGSSARAQFIAETNPSGMDELLFQEFKIDLVKSEGDWRIRRVEPLQALGL